jgi:hypothetical protein
MLAIKLFKKQEMAAYFNSVSTFPPLSQIKVWGDQGTIIIRVSHKNHESILWSPKNTRKKCFNQVLPSDTCNSIMHLNTFSSHLKCFVNGVKFHKAFTCFNGIIFCHLCSVKVVRYLLLNFTLLWHK